MKLQRTSLMLLACPALSGCESKQAKLDALTAQYRRAYKQYFDDCIEPAYGAAGAEVNFKGAKPKIPTPQEVTAHNSNCAGEMKQVNAIEQKFHALQK